MSELLTQYRKLRKYTQEELAEMTLLSTRQIQRIETGTCIPSLDTLKKLIFILDIKNKDVLKMVR